MEPSVLMMLCVNNSGLSGLEIRLVLTFLGFLSTRFFL